jgi:hypothetical protein
MPLLLRCFFVVVLLANLAPAQVPAPKPDPAFVPLPSDEKEPEKPAKPVYTYAGKPIKLPFECGEKDIEAFGLACSSDEPCETYLELSGIEQTSQRLFLTGNLHTSTTTLWSILLVSEDGGTTWSEPIERMRSTGLEQIQFVDPEYGWIGGQQLQALPRDPFLLVTTNGGASWRKQAISGESRVGAIERFYFEDRNNGFLLIDRTQTGDSGGRHEYYESKSGGDSWGLRQVSDKPIALKRPRLPNDTLRIRPDARTQSFRIERNTPKGWQMVASFLVKVGECRMDEYELKEPPPPPETEQKEDLIIVVPSEPGKTPRRPPTLRKKK